MTASRQVERVANNNDRTGTERGRNERGNSGDGRQQQDEAIIRRVLDGDREAFAELVEQYHRLVCHVAGHYLKNPDEVDDVAQEVFFRSYRALNRYNPEYRLDRKSTRLNSSH